MDSLSEPTRVKPAPDLPKDFDSSRLPMFMLEVQKLVRGRFQHVGYMNALFNYRSEAANYYNRYNPDMRKLNALKTWASDWNELTGLRFIIRENRGESMTIDPFDLLDLPTDNLYPTCLPRTAYAKDLPVLEYIVQRPRIDPSLRTSIVLFARPNPEVTKERVIEACGDGIKTTHGMYFEANKGDPAISFKTPLGKGSIRRLVNHSGLEGYSNYLVDDYYNNAWFSLERHNPGYDFGKFKQAFESNQLVIFSDVGSQRIPGEDLELLRQELHKAFLPTQPDTWSDLLMLP
jgi:hypothetical protein